MFHLPYLRPSSPEGVPCPSQALEPVTEPCIFHARTMLVGDDRVEECGVRSPNIDGVLWVFALTTWTLGARPPTHGLICQTVKRPNCKTVDPFHFWCRFKNCTLTNIVLWTVRALKARPSNLQIYETVKRLNCETVDLFHDWRSF